MHRLTPGRTAHILIIPSVIIALASVSVRTQGTLSTSADAINSTGYEDSPFLSPDGKSLYFMYTPWSIWPVFFGLSPVLLGPERLGHHINPDDNPWEDADIYVSTRADNGGWTTPRNLGFNDDQADCCAMTWDGSLFVYQRTQRPESALTDIYLVQMSRNGTWTRMPAGAGVNGAASSESNPHLSADGRSLFFTSDRSGGFGRSDLYVSHRQTDGTWGQAANLGSRFNTAASEDQPWVSRDGNTLYFNREPGPTIMVSTRSGAGGWSVPAVVRFGSVVPQAAEVSVSDDGSTMVFAEVRPDLEDIVFVSSQRQQNGTWGATRPLLAR